MHCVIALTIQQYNWWNCCAVLTVIHRQKPSPWSEDRLYWYEYSSGVEEYLWEKKKHVIP